MRSALLPIAAWAGVLQTVGPQAGTTDNLARLIGIASVLGTLTVLVYRLGVWRQEMEQTKLGVGEQHRRAMRWQRRTERRLERLERGERVNAGDSQ